MKRVLLIASALFVGIAVFVVDTNPGITQAQTATNVATARSLDRFRKRRSSIRTRLISKRARAKA